MLDSLFMDWSVRQDIGVQRAEMTADQASDMARSARTHVELMQADVERLLLITEALWIMLRDEHGYTDEQLLRKVQEIDLRDGRLDGKVAKQPPSTCPKCGRVMAARRPTCMYCGTPSTEPPFKR